MATTTVPQSATPEEDAGPEAVGENRDWVAWYDDLAVPERRELRARILTATPDEVKADDELRYFFIFHVDDLAADQPPGTRRLIGLYEIVNTLRGRQGVDEDRRKAVHFLLAEYQAWLRDNPWAE